MKRSLSIQWLTVKMRANLHSNSLYCSSSY